MERVGLSKEEVIATVFGGGGHIVILGAGASLASTQESPEKNGKKLPLMNNLIETVGISDIVDRLPKDLRDNNFENLYSQLCKASQFKKELVEMEKRIQTYFSDMRLPDYPTIYDYLVLSLRPRDLIASFNWDPFLYQAWNRNRTVADLPYIAFLHGNVAIGYSSIDKRSGPAGWHSKATSNWLEPTKLLYPVAEKNYSQDEYIGSQWDMFRDFLADKNVKRLSIFGYSAPDSDMEAIKILRESWLLNTKRDTEDIEVIDVKSEGEIRSRWNTFIASDYYSFKKSFFDSSLALNPRRTSESHFLHSFPMNEDEAFAESNPVPKGFKTLKQMWEWYRPLIAAEEKWKAANADNSTIQ